MYKLIIYLKTVLDRSQDPEDKCPIMKQRVIEHRTGRAFLSTEQAIPHTDIMLTAQINPTIDLIPRRSTSVQFPIISPI